MGLPTGCTSASRPTYWPILWDGFSSWKHSPCAVLYSSMATE